MREQSDEEATEIPVLIGDDEDFEVAWRAFALMEATNWSFLPSQLLEQDDVLMKNIFSIASYVNRIRKPNA
jgi:hypothetical protein